MGIEKRSLVDMIHAQLRSDIITLRYPLGAKLSVSALQTELGVSCTPIREAVNRLQQEGLVRYENNIGAHVLTLNRHDVVEIQQLAMTLHCAAIRLAMEQGDRGAILAGLEEQLAALRAASSPAEEVLAVNRFIGTFYHNSGNRRLDESMLSLQGQQLLLRHLYADRVFHAPADLEKFDTMRERAAAGDADGICAALQSYTDHMTEVLKERFPE